MNIKKFKKYQKLRKIAGRDFMITRRVDSPWFEDFWKDNPTRKQFNEIVSGLTITPDHFWILSGRK